MIKKSIALVLFVFLSLLLVSCSDEPSSIGSDLLGADIIVLESADSFTDSIPQSSYSELKHVPLGSSNRLLVGRHANVEASFLIRFTFVFPDSIKQDLLEDSLVISSSKVQFIKTYDFGPDAAPLELAIEKVISPWSSAGFIADSLSSLQTTPLLTDSLVLNDSILSFNIDNTVVLEWLKTAANPTLGSNWGIYLKPGANANKINGYQALIASSPDVPKITIIVEKPGVYIDTLSYNPLADISVLNDILPYPAGEFITVQAGLKIMSYLYFDLSELPPFSIVNKAEIILTADTTQGITEGDNENRLAGYIPADTTNLDSIASSVVNFEKNGNIYSRNVTAIVQDWLVRQNNRGIVLTTSNELNGLEKFVFWGSNAADPSKRPRLIITYTNKL